MYYSAHANARSMSYWVLAKYAARWRVMPHLCQLCNDAPFLKPADAIAVPWLIDGRGDVILYLYVCYDCLLLLSPKDQARAVSADTRGGPAWHSELPVDEYVGRSLWRSIRRAEYHPHTTRRMLERGVRDAFS